MAGYTIPWPEIDVRGKSIQQVALELALSRVAAGVREHGGNNRGPEIDEYAKLVGLKPEGAYPWCTSGAFCMYDRAAFLMRVRNPFPRTAKAVEVFNIIRAKYPQCLDSNPAPGAIGVLDHGAEWKTQLVPGGRLTDNGHIVFANEMDGVNLKNEVSGNTNRDGSREGDSWWQHSGDPSATHHGMIVAWVYLDRLQLVAA